MLSGCQRNTPVLALSREHTNRRSETELLERVVGKELLVRARCQLQETLSKEQDETPVPAADSFPNEFDETPMSGSETLWNFVYGRSETIQDMIDILPTPTPGQKVTPESLKPSLGCNRFRRWQRI